MLISVRSSVRSMKTCLEHTIFIFRPQILQDDFRKTSGRLQVLGLSHVSLMSFEALSLSFVCKSESKILRLVPSIIHS